MSSATVPQEVAVRPSPVRAAVRTSLCCWAVVAVGFGIARGADVATSSTVPSPIAFAAYSVLVFITIPALAGLVIMAGIAGVRGSSPGDWVHGAVVGATLGIFMQIGVESFAWSLLSAASGVLATLITIAGLRSSSRWRAGALLLVGALVAAALWAIGGSHG